MNKKKGKSTFKAVAAGLLSAAMLLTGGCGKTPSGPPSAQTGGKIAVITKQELSFWDDVKKGAQDACDEFGYEMMYTVADGDNDYVTQIAAINDAINKKAKAIVIAPNSETDLNDALNNAIENGIKVVVINSSVTGEVNGKISCKVASSESDGGTVAAKNALAAYTAKGGDLANVGKIGIVGHTASTAENRITGFIQRMTQGIANAKGIEVPAENPYAALAAAAGGAAGGDAAAAAQAAAAAEGGAPTTTVPVTTEPVETTTTVPYEELSEYEKAQVIMQQHEAEKKADDERQLADIKKSFVQTERCAKIEEAREATKKLIGTDGNGFSFLYATNTNTTLGVCAAVEELGLSGKITIIGFNSDDEELAYIRRGVLDGTIIQNPYIMGYVGVRYAKQAAAGNETAKQIDTGVTFVNSKNMNDEYIQLLLYPDKY